MTVRLRPMPTTRTAIRDRVYCCLYDYHPSMAGSAITVGDRWAGVSFYAGFTDEQYRDALSRLPWQVRISPAWNGLRITPVPDPEVADD